MNRSALSRRAVVIGWLAALAPAVRAHHSIASIYDFGRRLELDGIVARFEFVNPHPFLTMDVTRDGRAERWRLEMDNRWELAELGFTDDKLAPGDRIVVVANPSRSEARRGYVRSLERRSDGFKYRHHN